MVRALRPKLGTSQGTTTRVSEQLGYGVELVRQSSINTELSAHGPATSEQPNMSAWLQRSRNHPGIQKQRKTSIVVLRSLPR